MTSAQEQREQVRDMATRFAQQHIAPLVDPPGADGDASKKAVFEAGLETGFDRIALSEDAGGFGFGMPELCTLVESLAETSASYAMLFGVEAAARSALANHLPAAGEGRGLPLGLAIGEPVSKCDFDHTTFVFNAVSGGDVLRLSKDGDGAAVVTLLNLAELIRPIVWEKSLGLELLSFGHLEVLEHSPVAASKVIATGQQAIELYGSLLARLSLVSAACAAGLENMAYRKALAYASERYQGGKEIIDHTHLRTVLGAMAANCTVGSSVVLGAAADLSLRHALAAKISVTESCVRVCTDAVQILGGYGYMKDYGLEEKMRDAAMLALFPLSNSRAELLIAAADRDSFS
jgi:alkylation response protein AidB-like acyl-CoA dehydrogenase